MNPIATLARGASAAGVLVGLMLIRGDGDVPAAFAVDPTAAIAGLMLLREEAITPTFASASAADVVV